MPNADLDAVFDQAQTDEHTEKIQQLSGSLYSARQQNPDEAVKAQAAGVSPDILKAAPDLAIPDNHAPDRIVAETPRTAAHLSDPNNAAKFHDDIESLQQVEKTIQDWRKTQEDSGAIIHMARAAGSVAKGFATSAGEATGSILKNQIGAIPDAALTINEAAGIGAPYQFAPAMLAAEGMAAAGGAFHALRTGNFRDIVANAGRAAAAVARVQPPDPKAWDAQMRKEFPGAGDNAVRRLGASLELYSQNPQVVQDQAAHIGEVWRNDKIGGAALATRKVADFIGTVAPYIAAEILSLGQATLPLAAGAGIEGAEGARARGESPGTQLANAAGKAGTFFAAGKIAGMLPVQYFSKMLGKSIGDGVANEVVGSALTNGIKTALKQMYHGAVAGAGLTGGNAVTDYMTGDEHALDGVGQKMLESAAMFSISGPILGAGEVAGNFFHERAPEIQEAAQTKQHMLALAETTKASPAAQRDPAGWQKFLQEQTRGTHAENLHISPAEFDEVFSKHGIEPSAAATDLNASQAYADAKKYGHDIQIKSADVIAKLSEHPALEAFLDKAKSEPGGLTMEGVEKIIKEGNDRIIETQKAFDESLERVSEARKQNLIETGLPASQAETETKLFTDFVKKQTTELQRNPGQENATPEDFVKQMGLTERTPRKLSAIQKAKQILNMENGIEPEPVDEAGLTESERSQLELTAEKKMMQAGGPAKPISKFIRENGGIRMDTLPSGELEDMQGSKLATKNGKHQHDLMAEMLRDKGLLEPDQDMFQAIRDESMRAKNKQVYRQDARPVPESSEMQRWKDEAAKWKQVATTSPLTGLPNKLAFELAHEAEPFEHVVAFDLNNFKAFNTLLGHDAVDKQVLPQLGAVLAKVRAEVGLEIYHRSGDEFQIGFRHADKEATEQQIQRLHDRMAAIGADVVGIDKNTKEPVRYFIDGILSTHGTGKEYKDADAAAEHRKSELRAAGKLEDLRETGGVPRNFYRLPLDWDGLESSGDAAEPGGHQAVSPRGAEGELGPNDSLVPGEYHEKEQAPYSGEIAEPTVPADGGGPVRAEPAAGVGLRSSVKAIETSKKELGTSKITSHADAAKALVKIANSAHEKFDAVVTDKDGNVLGVIGGFKGAVAMSAVMPSTLASEAFSIKGAKNIWFAHNHPSGEAAFSQQDIMLHKGLRDIFEGSGIDIAGFIVVGSKKEGSTQKYGALSQRGGMSTIHDVPEPSKNKYRASVIEREMDQNGYAFSKPVVNAGVGIEAAAHVIGTEKPGILFLDSAARVTGGVHIPEGDKLSTLRDTGAASKLFKVLGKSNAAAVIIVSNDAMTKASIDNLGKFFESVQTPVRDVIKNKKSSYASEGTLGHFREITKGVRYDQKANAEINIRHEIAGDPASEFKATVQRFHTADLSSGIHELGHYMLESMRRLATMPNASDELKSDLATLEKHFEVEGGKWEKDHHEGFAHAWEKYCMEGRAPSAALRPVFATLRAWMRQVYEHIKNISGAPLNDDLRAVMDRMLATPEQIQVAHNFMGREAWISPTDNPDYARKLAKAHEQAESELTYQKNKDLIRQQKASWKAEYAKNEADVKAEMLGDQSRDLAYKAQMAFKGKDFDGEPLLDAAGQPAEPLRINIKAFEEKFGPDAARLLPRGTLTTDWRGLHPDVAAQFVGYKDGREMLADLSKVQPFAKELRDRTTALTDFMQPKLTRDRIAELALDAVHNDASAETLDLEMLTLGDKLGVLRKVLPKTADFKVEAQRTVAEIKVGDLNSQTYAVAEAKARRESMNAFAKDDMLGTYDALRRERQNHELYRAAMDAKKAVQNGLDYLGRFNKEAVREKIDLPFRNQIDALLDQYDLRRWVSTKALAEKAKLIDFVEGLAGDGHVPYIPESISKAMATYEALGDKAQRTHYKDMQLQDFSGMTDAVKSLEAMGKNQKTISDGKEAQDLNDAALAFREKAAELKQRAPESDRGLDRIGKMKAGVRYGMRSLQASLLKMEQMFDWLDGRDAMGNANKYGFRPIADAGGREKEIQDQVAGHLDKARAQWMDATKDGEGKVFQAPSGDGMLDGKLMAEGASLDEARQKLDHKQMLMLAGNWGNRSNIEKLCKGEGWREEVVKQFLDKNMTKADWDFVHQLSKCFEMVYKEKLEMHRRLGNTDPVRVEPAAFETPHGEYPGWYWPLVYDPARNQAVADRGARKGEALFENTFRRANTESGRDNTRIEGYAAPLLLSLDAIPKILADEIHDTTHREAIMNADKFFSHPDVRAGVINALSQEHYDQIRPWLQSIANDTKSDMRALKFFDRMAHGMRTTTTMTGLGFRLTTMVIHGSSAAGESIAELGNPKWFAQGLQALANPAAWSANKKFMIENSPEMKLRLSGDIDREMHDAFKDIDLKLTDPTLGAIARGKAVLQGRAMQGITGLDLASAMPTWMGGYLKGLAPESEGGKGLGHEDAVYFADKTLRNAHGGGGIKDLAAVQRGPEYFKLLTMFYSFWNHNVNRLMDTGKMAADPETWKDSGKAGQVVMRTLMYVFGVQAIHALFHKDEQEEHWYAWAAKAMMGAAAGGVPIARDLWRYYGEGMRDFKLSPVEEMLSQPHQTMVDAIHAYEGKHVSDQWVKHAIQTSGFLAAIPGAGQASQTAQFLWDVHDGRQNPEGIKEWFSGIVSGHSKEK